MTDHAPTSYRIYRYDADRGESVLMREGEATPVDPATLSPKIQKVLARLREEGKRFEQQFKQQARQRKSS